MLNKLFIIGRLTADAVVKENVQTNTAWAQFSLAFDSGKDETSFIECIALGNLIKSITYCHKGDKIACVGYIRQRKFKNKAGVDVSTIQFVVDSVEFCDVKKQEEKPVAQDTPF